MDSDTVERLLDGTAVDPTDGWHPLVSLLSAVRAAPAPGELGGEAAAVRAYHLALLGTPVTVPERRRGFALAGFGVRAALVGLLLAGTGGAALAAAGGVLPNPLRPSAPPAVPSTSASATPGSPSTGTDPRPGPPTGGTARPDPDESVVGLCRAYRVDAGDNPGRALDNPAFAELIGAAGGRDEVPGYCDRVLAGKPADGPGATPTERHSNQPTVRPTGRATQPPTPGTGQPTAPGDVPTTPSRTTGPK
ncbi:hypothetical protein [Micromonospora thermarum]|uniref:Uncharacterized protein n=1 Tax=Micromonospora thermarum TaxID=2720024 RepID=A0ABX0ZAW2_9ACTN|nr:hypothetical protein [Micromonospora thermarum]NJP34344.1 hypothetical protein [Micromonospora thermarum]